MILQIASITPAKNVTSNARGTNGSNNRRNSRAVNYTRLFTLIDLNAPEGDNACFILFGQGNGSQIFGMDDLSKSDGRIRMYFVMILLSFFSLIYVHLSNILFFLIHL